MTASSSVRSASLNFLSSAGRLVSGVVIAVVLPGLAQRPSGGPELPFPSRARESTIWPMAVDDRAALAMNRSHSARTSPPVAWKSLRMRSSQMCSAGMPIWVLIHTEVNDRVQVQLRTLKNRCAWTPPGQVFGVGRAKDSWLRMVLPEWDLDRGGVALPLRITTTRTASLWRIWDGSPATAASNQRMTGDCFLERTQRTLGVVTGDEGFGTACADGRRKCRRHVVGAVVVLGAVRLYRAGLGGGAGRRRADRRPCPALRST